MSIPAVHLAPALLATPATDTRIAHVVRPDSDTTGASNTHFLLRTRVAELEQRCTDLEKALQSNRRISLALGITLATLKITDTTAFEHLATLGQRQNRKMLDVAEEVNLTGAIPSPPSPQPLPPTDTGRALRDGFSRDGKSSDIRDGKTGEGHEPKDGSGPRDSSFTLRVDAETSIVTLIGEVDLAALPALARVENIICDTTTAAITVDCSELTFIDCAGLGELLSWNNVANRHGKVLSFRRVPHPLHKLLNLCALNGVLTVNDYLTAPRP